MSSSTISILAPYVYLWQLNLNGCANPFLRPNGDATSHPLGQLSTDGQPQPKAFGVAFSPIETLENVGKVGRAYPRSSRRHARVLGEVTHLIELPQAEVTSITGFEAYNAVYEDVIIACRVNRGMPAT